jgi:2-hydroxy-3-oxopropionate reductase
MTSTPLCIAVLGTGMMGQPIARRLSAAGHTVHAWNRTRSKAEPLAACGVTVHDTAAGAVQYADIVVSLLENGPVVGQVLFEAGTAQAMRKNALFIDMASIQPSEARDHAARMEEMANQMIVGITIGAVAEALLLAAKGGADMAKVREAISGGFADSRILQLHGQRMVERDFAPRGRMAVQLKDMRNALATAREIGFDAPITALFEGLYAQGVEHGLGELDHSGLFVELASRNAMQ